MVKSLSKSIFRFFKKQLGRLFAVSFIIALGVGVISSLSAMPTKLKNTVHKLYNDNLVPDLIIKSDNVFSKEQITNLESLEFVQDVEGIFTYEAEIDGKVTRIYNFNLKQAPLNKLKLIEGRWPENSDEVVVERDTHTLLNTPIGETISFMGQNKIVVGTVFNTLLFSNEKELSYIKNEAEEESEDKYRELNQVVYIDKQYMDIALVTEVYLKVESKDYSIFSKKYKKLMEEYKALILEEENTYHVLTLRDNKSFVYYEETVRIIERVCIFFSIFFGVVALLVVLSTIKRMIEEDRGYIACLKTLGYSSSKEVEKYLLFTLLTGIIGCTLGIIFIDELIVRIIYNTFYFSFFMPPLINKVILWIPIFVSVIMIGTSLLVTFLAFASMNKENPAQLMLPKSPKVGRKTIIEKITFIWKRLSFKYKSTMRNLFRYARHFIMAIISIAGSCALIFTGLSLYDFMSHQDNSNSIAGISLVLIVIAGLLSVLVLYNLTNINIEERKREIATLMVLGYKDSEVCGYIYRETKILSFIGVFFGVPMGAVFIHFLLKDIDLGTIADINWYVYIGSIVLTITISLVVELLLHHKILAIDMNGSLKSIE